MAYDGPRGNLALQTGEHCVWLADKTGIRKIPDDDMVCLQCTATGERVCLAAEGFGNRHCFLENIADKVRV
ncbi:hypothetical protein AVEN_257994-1 [Araneus ventricosus]|uniref:Inositol 1,4,5-trisphosphate/ryanodine receptor domain-containing protein n=1 Tax=Araneus ventricosus TaxID=182803 RepID=A0A4Y2G0Z5_ARAVE|nr:hypothetical protein AVEN_257994-1 [Araneus ventricosus]